MQDRLGAIPRQLIAEMINAGYVHGASTDALQPSSLDLHVTGECYRMRGSYLPKPNETILDLVKHGSLFPHPIEQPLETNGTYFIKLSESLALPPGIHASTSSKSSSGRINLRTRLLADGVARFDSVPAGYNGTLWLEVIPKSFPVLLHIGDRLNQMRFFHGEARLSALEHRMLADKFQLLRYRPYQTPPQTAEPITEGLSMSIDLSLDVVGWRAHPTPMSVLDTAKYDHDISDFFEPVMHPKRGEVVLQDGSFYILATKEHIIIPPNYAVEMAPYDPTKGEFRSHYAGFFDPGFGWSENEEEKGRQAVLEICTLGQDVILRDGQPICLMVYEKLVAKPDMLYGQEIQSNYSNQEGPRLAKWFKMP